MSVYKQIRSGDVAFPHQRETSPCYAIMDGYEKEYALRVVANENNASNNNDSWKQCKISINDQEMNTVPYQSVNNELVFVTQNAQGTIANKISVQCNDKQATISSVGVYDDALHYGLKIPKIASQPHAEKHILFTAMTEMQKVQMSKGRKVLSADANHYDHFMDVMTSKLDQAIDLFSEWEKKLSTHKAASGLRRLPLKVGFKSREDRRETRSTFTALDSYKGRTETAFESQTSLPSSSDYVLRFQNIGPFPIEIALESEYIDAEKVNSIAESVMAELNLDEIASDIGEEIGEIESNVAGSYGSLIACILLFGFIAFLLKKIVNKRSRANRQVIEEKIDYLSESNDENYRLMDDIDIIRCE